MTGWNVAPVASGHALRVTELASPDRTLTAVRVGDGRDLVILHSLLTDRHAFDPVLDALAKRFRVTLINLPGFHGSAAIEPSIKAYAACIAGGFDQFEIARDASLIGNGFGGTLALAVALAHGDRIGKLVVCDAAASFPSEGKRAFAVMAEKVVAGGLGAIADIAANRVFHGAYLAAHPSAIDERRQSERAAAVVAPARRFSSC